MPKTGLQSEIALKKLSSISGNSLRLTLVGESKKHYSPIEGIIAVLDEGAYTGTNKLALLLALIDLAPRIGERNYIEHRELAEYLMELQWGHTDNFQDKPAPKQLTASNIEDQKVLIEIKRIKNLVGAKNFHQAKADCPNKEWNKSITAITAMLKKNPIPKLQTISKKKFEFLYYVKDQNAKISLFPESKQALIEYGGVLRSLVETRFVRFVSQTNYKQDTFANLEVYLFGADRFMPPPRMRKALFEVQAGKCIYTKKKLIQATMQVDHVLPWSRNPISHIENFALTSKELNGRKSNLLPSKELIENWMAFEIQNRNALEEIAKEFNWPADLGVVSRSLRSIYAQVPDGTPIFSPSEVTPLSASKRKTILNLLTLTTGN